MKSVSLQACVLSMFSAVILLPANAQNEEIIEHFDGDPNHIQSADSPIVDSGVVDKQNTFSKESIGSLDAEYQKLLAVLKTEDAFSLKLAESYMEYGNLLAKFQRYDEAKKTFTEALHILKVNHGIYAYEQLSALRALTDLAIDDNQSEDLVTYLNRIGNLVRKDQNAYDDQLDKMFLRAGYYYIDLFKTTRNGNLKRLEHLVNAKRIFNSVLEQNKKELLSSNRLPYSELLLVSYLESTLVEKLPAVFQRDRDNDITSLRTGSGQAPKTVASDSYYLQGSFRRALRYADRYLVRARLENDEEHISRALLAQADLNILFGFEDEAAKLYKATWQYGVDSTSINTSEMNQPVRIPDFNYLGDYDFNARNQKVISVPVSFTVAADGRISKITSLALDEDKQTYYSKAKRALRKMSFRPALIEGDVEKVENFIYSVPVLVK